MNPSAQDHGVFASDPEGRGGDDARMRPHDRTAGNASTPPRAEVDARTVEQELAAGRTAATPLAALGSVLGVVTLLVTFALALVVLAYFLA